MIITDLRLWKDCGYTEGSMVKPPINDSLSGYDMRITEDISPSRDRIFSEIRLRTPFDDLYLMTYLQATYEMSDGSTFTFYGWIDAVQPISDSDTPTTAIIWHIDYWRTYASNATYGSGMVTRRPSSSTQPPQPVNYRYIEPISSAYESFITDREDVWWVCIRFTEDVTFGTDKVTRVKSACYPVSASKNIQGFISGAIKASVPTLGETENGLMDELLGLDPMNIISAFVSPCSPINGYWDTDYYYHIPGYADLREGNMGVVYCVYGQPMEPIVVDRELYSTTDYQIVNICGFDGETIGAIPWGIKCTSYDYRVVFESVSAYIQLRLYPNGRNWGGSHQTGLTYTLPLPALEITENSWSSYVYGGARQADIDGRRIEAERSHMQFMSTQLGNFTSGAVSGATSGAVTGAMIGAIGGPVGFASGAIIGAAGSLIGNATNLLQHHSYQSYLTGSYDDQMQDMLDTQHAAQADGILMQGNGFDAVRNGVQAPAIIRMTYDDYSVEQWENNISIYGATVSEPRSSCSSLIRAGGPLRIDNLEVTGDIPNPARAYIRDAFRKGVILK